MKEKKQYLTPRMKVMKMQQAQMLCGSVTEPTTSQNEKYEEVSSDDTNSWFGW